MHSELKRVFAVMSDNGRSIDWCDNKIKLLLTSEFVPGSPVSLMTKIFEADGIRSRYQGNICMTNNGTGALNYIGRDRKLITWMKRKYPVLSVEVNTPFAFASLTLKKAERRVSQTKKDPKVQISRVYYAIQISRYEVRPRHSTPNT
jgi:hypothetical protein